MAKNHGERIATLEANFAQTVEYFKDIKADSREVKDHLATLNGSTASIKAWQQRVIGAGMALSFIVAATAGTLITVVATRVL